MEPARAERVPDGGAPDAAAPIAVAAAGHSPAAYALRLQAAVGNRAATAILRQSQGAATADPDRVPREMVPFHQGAVSRPRPAYNEGRRRGHDVDPEQARGVLPFTADGWNAQSIVAHMGQLTGTGARSDAVACVEASFISELVMRGPDAVRASIAGYIARYRERMTSGASRRLLARRDPHQARPQRHAAPVRPVAAARQPGHAAQRRPRRDVGVLRGPGPARPGRADVRDHRPLHAARRRVAPGG